MKYNTQIQHSNTTPKNNAQMQHLNNAQIQHSEFQKIKIRKEQKLQNAGQNIMESDYFCPLFLRM